MPLEPEFLDCMNVPVVWNQKTGEDAWGNDVQTASAFNTRLDLVTELTGDQPRAEQLVGRDVMRATLIAPLQTPRRVTVGDEIIIDITGAGANSPGYVYEVKTEYDQFGPHHIVIELDQELKQ